MTHVHRTSAIVSAATAALLLGCGGSQPAPAPALAPEAPAEPVAEAPVEPAAEPPAEAPAESAVIGQPAPDFTLTDLDGNQVTLSSLRGKPVVLEWFNPQCPFIVYAHTQGPLADAAARPGAEDAVWLAINSGAAGKQGHGADLNRAKRTEYGMDYPLLLDEDGAVGKAYGARTTPHMFVIDAEGVLVYQGALDNAPLGKADGELTRYVVDALAAVQAGEPVATAETVPYGCSVKY